MTRYGNCYAASEALWHLTGGRKGPWKPMVVRCTHYKAGRRKLPAQHHVTHWYLKHKVTGEILDPSARQFRARGWWKAPDYKKGRGCGFLTRWPSERARILIRHLTWSLDFRKPRKAGRRA